MKLEEYKCEIELIEKQNNVEYDLYTVVASVLKERKPFKTISLRFVGHCRRTQKAKKKVFWALRGFPDFVVLDKQYKPVEKSIDKSMIYGTVEVKGVGLPILESNDDRLQLVGHLLWFDKVIYTNGYEWRFYRNIWTANDDEVNKKQDISYKKYCKTPKNIEEEKMINEYLGKFDISELHYDSFILCKKVNDKRKWDNKEWDKLIKYLDKYNFVNLEKTEK